ncbi:stage 0 sporulation family protein [bacterium]|nr:stage 0 sporulation family protein [bacterium]
MPLVVGVTFRRVGKVYYFDPGDLALHEGDFVIAETARGVEFGEIVLEPREVPEEELVAPLKRVVRVATGDDLDREASNRQKEKHAYEVCDRKIAEHNLPMKLLEAECAFDGSQVTFSFSADGRIDFRELVKDVAGALKTKVQLHQIGVRDEAKLIGGYGGCGRALCCATFLSSFEPISMKMAKDQSLFLNPAKFSGVCGKLMCCLRYEHEHYKLSQQRLPAVGAILQLENCRAKVIDVNVINDMITLQTEEEVQVHMHASELNLEGICRRHGVGCGMSEKNCQPLVACECAARLPVVDDDEDDITDDAVLDMVEPATLVDEMSDVLRSDSGVTWRVPGEHTKPEPAESGNGNGGAKKPGGSGNGSRNDRQRRRSRNRRPNGQQPKHNHRNNSQRNGDEQGSEGE